MSLRTPGRHALLFILITIFVDTVAFGIIIPVLPKLIAELGDTPISEAAAYGGLLMFVFALMQFLFAPVIGNLSDRFGRRPVLLVSLTALGIDYVIMGFAPSLVWLFVGRMIAGVAAATFATANAYIADITDEEERAARFGLIGAAW
ncbi:MAG: MFS transporter, partial [Gammaproteobacteria bacterium]|nr:MFS transporter [Gammaproteobacteria bacterium]